MGSDLRLLVHEFLTFQFFKFPRQLKLKLLFFTQGIWRRSARK